MVGKWMAQNNDKLVNSTDDKEYSFRYTILYNEQTIWPFSNQKPYPSFPEEYNILLSLQKSGEKKS